MSAGAKIYPAEVERVLREHPAIAEAAVIGIPDERLGEAVAAVVMPRRRRGCSPATTSSPSATGRIADYKRPTQAFLSDTLPRTGEREGAEGEAARDVRGARREAARRFEEGRLVDIGGIELWCHEDERGRRAAAPPRRAVRRALPLRLRAAVSRGLPPRHLGAARVRPVGPGRAVLGRRLGERPRAAARRAGDRARPRVGERLLVVHRLRLRRRAAGAARGARHLHRRLGRRSRQELRRPPGTRTARSSPRTARAARAPRSSRASTP